MPIYEYECEKCHHQLEALQKISDKPLRECPECGQRALKRLVSAPLFRLAGSGWYETDFKSDKEAKRNLAGKDEAPAAEPSATKDEKSSTPTETKPADAKPAAPAPAPAAEPRKASVKKPATKPVKTPPAAKKVPVKGSSRRR
jgi:putative FmdB family regulatory protein